MVLIGNNKLSTKSRLTKIFKHIKKPDYIIYNQVFILLSIINYESTALILSAASFNNIADSTFSPLLSIIAFASAAFVP